ncbi:MAG TPA: hypothetical protein V6C97_10390 [Oculatellaceae cyanobacterium]
MNTKRSGRLPLAVVLAAGLLGFASNASLSETVYQGSVCSSRVESLTGQIDWQTNLKKAQEQAQKENKLVFWMHMLGKIDGAT